MRKLTQQSQQAVIDIANRYSLSQDAVLHMLDAVIAGGGTMAQFNCPELGGNGQWMQGGMTMVGDMFNYGLKATVDNLCSELSNLTAQQKIYEQPTQSFGNNFSMSSANNWWPVELGSPDSTGAQNNVRYAYFANINRLAIDINDQVTIYDTLDHQIGGVSQQQGFGSNVTFNSQYGVVNLSSLPIVNTPNSMKEESAKEMQTEVSMNVPENNVSSQPSQSQQPVQQAIVVEHEVSVEDRPEVKPETLVKEQKDETKKAPIDIVSAKEVISLLEQLGKLKEMGILTEEEFSTKKAELLSRIN